jgi:2-polyprenyl-3-methyl-5-hydroxy-6-metoxy-1,4-benzoquinol methylase
MARACGARVRGIELDRIAQEYLASIGIETSGELNGKENTDIITALQVIEHLEDPRKFLAQVSQNLVRDGRLLLSLPNGGEFEQVGAGWIGFRVDLEHFNYFSVKTLARLLQSEGLYVEHAWTHTQPQICRASTLHNPEPWFWSVLPFNAWTSRVMRSGGFVLTVLARKI